VSEPILNLRTKHARRMVGTNAIFVRSDVFTQIRYNDGFLEDVGFSDQLIRRFGKEKLAIMDDFVTVSSDKYLNRGPLKSILVNSIVMIFHRFLKVDRLLLERFYRSKNHDSCFLILKSAAKLATHSQ